MGLSRDFFFLSKITVLDGLFVHFFQYAFQPGSCNFFPKKNRPSKNDNCQNSFNCVKIHRNKHFTLANQPTTNLDFNNQFLTLKKPWTNKLSEYFEALSSQPKPFKYHIGLHYVNGGYFWEQAIGIPLIPVSTPLYPLDNVPSTTQQCVRNIGTLDSEDLKWDNENCFNDVSPLMCEVPACDTENYCP